MKVLTVDDLTLETRWSERRRTLEITVDRGGELVVHAPPNLDPAMIKLFVRKKRSWIQAKLAEKQHLRHMSAREFKSGEGFEYLGRSFRLLLVSNQDVPLKLEHGRFRLLRTESECGRAHFVRWYTNHAYPWLSVQVEKFAPRVAVEPKGVEVRDLGFRWASCGKRGNLRFHWAVIQMPPRVIEYIVVHELVHMREPDHTPGFWRFMERVVPDLEARRRWLAENGARLTVLSLATPRPDLIVGNR